MEDGVRFSCPRNPIWRHSQGQRVNGRLAAHTGLPSASSSVCTTHGIVFNHVSNFIVAGQAKFSDSGDSLQKYIHTHIYINLYTV